MQSTVLLTGASRGIGRSIARLLINDGYSLSLGLRDPEALREQIWTSRVLCIAPTTPTIRPVLKPWLAAPFFSGEKSKPLIQRAGILHRTQLLFADSEEQQQQLDEL